MEKDGWGATAGVSSLSMSKRAGCRHVGIDGPPEKGKKPVPNFSLTNHKRVIEKNVKNSNFHPVSKNRNTRRG
jgi:hypothetical protein